MTKLICPSCGVVHEAPFHPENEDFNCSCGGRRVPPGALKPRKPLNRTSPRNGNGTNGTGLGRKRGSTLKRGRGFAVTKAQREKVRGLPCVACGREASEYVAVDPAHIWSCGGRCTNPLCIAPLCRDINGGCHRRFDLGELDLLSLLIDRGYHAELGHVISAHQVSPLTLVEHVTGQRYEPVREAVA